MQKTISRKIFVTALALLVAMGLCLSFGSARSYAASKPDTVKNVKATTTTSTKGLSKADKKAKLRTVKLSWAKISGATKYKVTYATKAGGKYKTATSGSFVKKTSVTLKYKKNKTIYLKVNAYNGKTAGAASSVSVKAGSTNNASKVTISPSQTSMKEGDTATWKATVNKGISKNVKWASSNTAVAAVSSKGVVTAKKAGTAKISATAHNGLTAVKTIKVSEDLSKYFAGGSGTVQDPWQIKTAEQFNNIRKDLDGNFKLMNDISLSTYKNFEPIGTFVPEEKDPDVPVRDYAFCGVFDGNKNKISDITIDKSGTAQSMGVGPFGVVAGSAATVKDFTVENSNVKGVNGTGGIVGYAYEATVSGLTLTGNNNEISGVNMAGGIVGAAMDQLTRDCTVENANVSVAMPSSANTPAAYVGLVVGGGEGTSLSNCDAKSGTVTGGDNTNGIGGIAGSAIGAKYINDCDASNVTVNAGENTFMIGGVAGFTGTDSGNRTQVRKCTTQNVTINAKNSSKRIGMITGSGFYQAGYEAYFPVPTAFDVVKCNANGAIVTTGDGTATQVGAIAGYVYNNSKVSTTCQSKVTLNGKSIENVPADGDETVDLEDITPGM